MMDSTVLAFLKSKRFWTVAVTLVLRQFGVVDQESVDMVVGAALILWPIVDSLLSKTRDSL